MKMYPLNIGIYTLLRGDIFLLLASSTKGLLILLKRFLWNYYFTFWLRGLIAKLTNMDIIFTQLGDGYVLQMNNTIILSFALKKKLSKILFFIINHESIYLRKIALIILCFIKKL